MLTETGPLYLNQGERGLTMGTRGAIAIRNGDGWVGVYNHWDSYPTGLGKELWDYLHQDGIELEQFARDLLGYDDWRNYRQGGICPYCGRTEKGQPHSISGLIFARSDERFTSQDEMRAYYQSLPAWQGRDAEIEKAVRQEWQIRGNIERTGYPDPDARHHQHGDRSEKITSENADPLFIEWVYVIDPKSRILTVLAHRRAEGTHTETNRRGEKWQQANYVHYIVDTFPVDGHEPDWQELQDKARAIAHEAYQMFDKQ